ncbi:DUF2974 domain-containing protein, partial [bacterium]|nr:DUF2974 domain-containing protein [bacterium]
MRAKLQKSILFDCGCQENGIFGRVRSMGKTMDYLQWRGDLNFSKDPFNDVDALILALLSYLPFKDIVPGIELKEEITLKETSARYFSEKPKLEIKPSNINPTASSTFDSELVELLKTAASCPRFSDIRLSRYDENTDFSIGRQFAAVTFTLHNLERSKVVAFRGTDNSLVGWKEDFKLTCMEQIPAQESACKYLERTIGLLTSQFIVCGHSKGGNLAMYAGSHLNAARQSRLTKIINFDGPGFDFSIVNKESFTHCEHKIFSYIPEESIVGMLLEPVGKRTVVASSGRFMSQHDALNWGVVRSKFLCGTLSSNARLLEQTLKTWLTDISLEEREMFLEALFDILGASEGAALRFDPQENIKEIKNIL